MTFVQLQVKSTYTLLESTTKVADLVQTAKEQGYQSLALTDTNVVYGLVDFYKAAQAADIQPILGLTIEVGGLQQLEERFPLILLAKDQVGYQHLLQISSQIMCQTEMVSFEAIQKLLSHLIVITPAQKSEVVRLLLQDADQQAQAYLAQLKAAVDADSLYLGISDKQAASPQRTGLIALSQASQVPLVALGDVRYLQPTDAFSVQVLQHIKAGTQINLQTTDQEQPGGYYLQSATQITAEFEALALAEAVQNTQTIAAACQVELTFKRAQLPRFETPQQESANDYLETQSQSGLEARFAGASVPAEYQSRLQYELKVIFEMGFADYFLIVADVMAHAHQQQIMTGPGRGSAAGSLVAYALAITDVDPIQYQLLFERFLNPNRANMPDIDLDIPDNRRDEVLDYVYQKYGYNHMAQIITFGTLAAKMALRDVGRVFGLSQFEMSSWSKAIPNVLKISLQEAYQQSQVLQNLVADSQQNRLLFETAQRIEGLPRHYSTHAAGIVLSQAPLTDTVALQSGGDAIELTQFPMGNVEELGLLKIDFLGLRNLGILANIVKLVGQQTGQSFDPHQIPLDDQATLALFQQGDTNGIFQFESAGIKNVLRRLKPTSFEDIVATDALYRPGPMENIDTFIARKNGQEPVTYPDDSLATILAPTYGIIVYQEQVMQVASEMGGFTLGEADLLRRAMSKKKKAVIDANRTKFIQGALERGHSEAVATKVYDYIERFANYGFNRSHAVAYSKIAYWLAYLKVHYPAAFFAALLNAVLNQSTKTKTYLTEAKKRQITVRPPDINRSQRYFKLDDDGIIFGLYSIKGLRRDFVVSMLTERQTNGPYQSLLQFLQRIDRKFLKSDNLTALIYSGAFDGFNANRNQLLTNLPDLLDSIQLAGDSLDLFEVLAPKPKDVPNLTLTERLDKEAEYLGAYLSGHPVEKYERTRRYYHIPAISELHAGQNVRLVLFIRRIKVIRTKKGDQMAFVTGQDATGEISITIFANLYQQVASWLATEQVLLVTGKIEERRELQIVANQIQLADDVQKGLPKATLYLRVQTALTIDQERQLYRLLEQQPGQVPVILYNAATKQSILLKEHYWVNGQSTLTTALTSLLGTGNAILKGFLES
ncbi:DNA polymerase III subunit alpha [Latilactobacillus fuchuensis]|uniref:DNA polymerase III subunit alpha n=1 Tax=Latilactobacillus fuchuensis TaxID=164393 RepID=A0A2N9DVP5_9LACO|nr:DNA polymerase III subunit alpha [Latilactobacillus fuchuensis]SPC38569.1 DNA polymerase III (alpha subunit), DnaE3 [Latilactobacillus fuchuensis]